MVAIIAMVIGFFVIPLASSETGAEKPVHKHIWKQQNPHYDSFALVSRACCLVGNQNGISFVTFWTVHIYFSFDL